ncbi:sulfite exporter TauE/SafE family protein 2-like [Mercurialis annua]|uniref:sulfite exporter TauE/SafE family protein 2-like n=1 Tax=Mercurialis annua TaxID=3986 RepID=UPI00215EFDFC|nr:sulfite exporter TauE/SafE family protein 2-like [Mercurialis annua]
MAALNFIKISLILTILISFHHSNAKQTLPFSSSNLKNYLTQSQEPLLKLTSPMFLAGVLCFAAASISSAGGGGLFIPILTILAGLDLKTASSFSAFMVTGGSLANVMCHSFSYKFGGKGLIDYDIALLSEPCMLLGVSIGVICNLVFPEWLITILFVVFLVWSTFKTCKNGVVHWNLESEVKRIGYENVEFGKGISEEIKVINEPLLKRELENKLSFSWEKLVILVLIWLSFSFVYLLRGNRYGEGIVALKPCGVGYWVVSSLQIPLAIIFTAWILFKKSNYQNQTANLQGMDESAQSKLMFPMMALLAGMLGGVFGIGGGMLISPLLLHVGIHPEVTAATCSFMVLFSSTMSAFQYLLAGMEHIDTALIFAVICFVASLVGLLVVQKSIQKNGRASIIVFSVSVVMGLSTILITSFGAIDVWRDFESGTNMSFKLPC